MVSRSGACGAFLGRDDSFLCVAAWGGFLGKGSARSSFSAERGSCSSCTAMEHLATGSRSSVRNDLRADPGGASNSSMEAGELLAENTTYLSMYLLRSSTCCI